MLYKNFKLLSGDIEVVFVVPTNKKFEIPQLFQSLPNSTFCLKTISINQWEHQKQYCPKNIMYIALVRSKDVIYCEPYEEKKINTYLTDIVLSRFSHVEDFEQRNLSKKEDYFLLKSNSLPIEYENVAFIHRNHTNLTFYHQFLSQQPETSNFEEKNQFQLRYCKNDNDACVFLKQNEAVNEFVAKCLKTSPIFNGSYTLVVVSDTPNQKIHEFYLSEFRKTFSGVIPVQYMTWDEFEPYRKNISVSRSETSYFLVYSLGKHVTCYMYPMKILFHLIFL